MRFLLILAFCILSSSVYAQTAISSCPYTASSPGNYVVTSNLGSSGTCITANVDDVTIDLQGYTLTGNGTGSGIFSQGAGYPSPKNLIVTNGTIIGFDYGILSYGQDVLLFKLHVLSNTTDGVNLTDRAVLDVVESIGNGVRGAVVGGHTLILKSRFDDNGGIGIDIGSQSQIINSDVSDNGSTGITGTGRLVNVTVKGNGADGVDLTSNSSDLNSITDSDISHNTNDGVNIVCPGIISHNAIRRNNTNITTSGTCTLFDNVIIP